MARRWTATMLLSALLVCSGCGAPAAGPTTTAASTPAAAVAQPPAGSVPAAETAAQAQAAMLLNRLPAFPGAHAITPRPYVRGAPPTGARPQGAAVPTLGPGVGTPSSPYLIDLYREWRVTAAPNAVLAWVKQQAAARGLVQDAAAGPCQGTGCRTVIEGLAFALTPQADLTPGVQVGVESLGDGQSLVRYDAMVIWTPPRPKGENLPAGITTVRVQARSGLPQNAVRAVTVTDHKQVALLVALVQSLPRDTYGARTCPADVGREIVLDFLGPSGQSVTVREGSCDDVRFGPPGAYPALTDPGLRLWTDAMSLAGEPGWA